MKEKLKDIAATAILGTTLVLVVAFGAIQLWVMSKAELEEEKDNESKKIF